MSVKRIVWSELSPDAQDQCNGEYVLSLHYDESLTEIERLRGLLCALVPADLYEQTGLWVDGSNNRYRKWHDAEFIRQVREALGSD